MVPTGSVLITIIPWCSVRFKPQISDSFGPKLWDIFDAGFVRVSVHQSVSLLYKFVTYRYTRSCNSPRQALALQSCHFCGSTSNFKVTCFQYFWVWRKGCFGRMFVRIRSFNGPKCVVDYVCRDRTIHTHLLRRNTSTPKWCFGQHWFLHDENI